MISVFHGVPYVPVKRKIVRRILEAGEIKEDDVFYDLGSGDGRVMISAVRDFNVREAIGYEIAPRQYWKSKFLIKRAGLDGKVKIFRKNFFEADLSRATLIYLYLFPELVKKLAPKLAKELKPGSKVVSVSFAMADFEKHGFELIKQEKIDKMSVFLYEKI